MADDRAYEAPTLDRLLASLNNGDDNASATEDYRRLVERLASMVESYSGTHKGKLTLEFEFKADAKGVDVALKTKTAMPVRPVLKDRLFIGGNKGDVLTFRDPARGTFFEGSDLGRRRFGEN